MGRFSILRLIVLCSLCLDLGFVQAFTGTYGINYGQISDNIPGPENVVKLLKAAKIKNVRIFDSNHTVIEAFKGSGLELIVGLSNEHVKDMNASEDKALDWVEDNVQQFLPETPIRGIAIGNEVLGGSDQELEQALVGAVKNVYRALDRLHLTNLVQVLTSHSQNVFASSYPPSSCVFNENIVQYMKPLLEFFTKIGSPFNINVYPFIAYKGDSANIDINYALFQSDSGIYDEKSDLHYDNMFDATVDAAYFALQDAGYEQMEVIVTETGWASSGDEDEAGATVQNARTYNFNLRKRLAKRRGTPHRPKIVMKAYIFALFNEDLKSGPGSERHYGLYKPDGTIAYDIGFPSLKKSHASLSLLSIKINMHCCSQQV
ncbi:glucan endo-1,3-beta-glucosidase 11-like isoform X2 [Asparagus officinalis]|uniref:glucan endo-1,3-beta-glucosidase 11-like isoform X2 n=1 Tax=Asparagus officinalis TaxID=4686 RepID=UPI00098E3E6E|nr:glucan endo-1,3-beta-glucosidase 11-like isoform X2 [Asparagus officinalis]